MSHRRLAPRLLVGACIAASFAAAPAARAQCDAAAPLELTGHVIDARDLAPVPARVLVTAGADTLAALDADSAGRFAATVCRRGALVAHFRRIGYRADSLALAADAAPWTALDVAMTPLRGATPVMLAESRVTAPRTTAAMQARVQRAGGIYVGARELEAAKVARTSDAFRGRRGVTLEEVEGVMRIISSRGARSFGLGGTPAGAVEAMPVSSPRGGSRSCPLRVGVDGRVMPEDFRIDEIAAKDLRAIEIYAGAATVPVEFGSTRSNVICGLVMIWTRDGTRTSP